MIIVRAVNQPGGLILQGFDHRRVAMAEVIDRHAGEKIEIFLVVNISQPAALTTFGNQRIATIGFGDMRQPPFNPAL